MTIYGTMICVGRIDTSYRGDVEILSMLTDKQGGKPMEKIDCDKELQHIRQILNDLGIVLDL